MARAVVNGEAGGGYAQSDALAREVAQSRSWSAYAERYKAAADYYGVSSTASRPSAVQEAQARAQDRGWTATRQRYQAQAESYASTSATQAKQVAQQPGWQATAQRYQAAADDYGATESTTLTMEAPALTVEPELPPASITLTAETPPTVGQSPELVVEGGPGWGAAYVSIPYGPGVGYEPVPQVQPVPGGAQIRLPLPSITPEDVATLINEVDWGGLVDAFTPDSPTPAPGTPSTGGGTPSAGEPVGIGDGPAPGFLDWLLSLLFRRPQAEEGGGEGPVAVYASTGGTSLADLWQTSPAFRVAVVGLGGLVLWRVLSR